MTWIPMRKLRPAEMNPGYAATFRRFGLTPPDEVWVNNTYECAVKHEANGELMVLSINRFDRAPARDWRHLQQIKNEVCGPECEGVELYPAESRLVDTANQTYLHVFKTRRLAIGFPEGRVMSAETNAEFNRMADGKGKQRPWEPGLTTGKALNEDRS